MAPDLIDDQDDAEGSSPESLLQFLSHHKQNSQRRRERSRRFRKRRQAILVLLAIAAAFGLVALNVVIWGNFTHLRFVGHTPAGTTTPKSTVTTSVHHHSVHPAPSRASGAKDRHTRAPAPRRIIVRLTAARFSSWVQIRTGSARGRVLFQGVIPAGHSVRVTGRRLWARFGSLGNLDVSIDGHVIHPALNGTLDTVITAAGIRTAPTQAPSG